MGKAKLYIDDKKIGEIEDIEYDNKNNIMTTFYSTNRYSFDYLLDKGICSFLIDMGRKNKIKFEGEIEEVTISMRYNINYFFYDLKIINVRNKEMVNG